MANSTSATLAPGYDFADTRPVSELLPWLFLMPDQETIVCKDSSLLALFEFQGVDPESADEFSIENAALQLDSVLRSLGETQVRVWFRSDRIDASFAPDEEEDAASFNNPMSAEIDRYWREALGRDAWQNIAVLGISMPTQQASRTVAAEMREMIDAGVSLPHALGKALWKKVRGQSSDRIGFATEEELENAFARFQQNLVTPLLNGLHSFKLNRLSGPDLLGYLRFLSSTGDIAQLQANEFSYLDAVCSDTWIDNRHRDFLVLDGPKQQYVAVLSLKTAPASDRLCALSALMALPIPLTISQIWCSQTKQKSISVLKDIRTFDELRGLDLKTLLRGAAKRDRDLVEVEEAQEPRTEVGKAAMLYVDGILNGKDAWGYGALSVIVRANSEEQLKRHVERVQQECDKSLLAFLREREGALSGFSTSLIGNARDPLRWFLLEASNITDLAPLITLTPSSNEHPHFSKLALADMPAHTVAKNRYGTLEYVNYHIGEVGHTLYIGPTSAGKTVQKMMMTSQAFKYPHFRSIIFDKDSSCQGATLLHGGKWVDLMDSSDSRVKMNPMAMIHRVNGISWIIGWLDRLMAVRGDRLSNKELETLSNALDRLAEMGDPYVRLSSLAAQLPMVLKDRLAIWCEGGAWGAYFDNPVDELDFSSITCFEVGGLMTAGMTDVLRAFTDYVFFRVELRVNEAQNVADIGPTEVYFEEAGYLLDDPIFADRAVNDLMTLRKKQGYLVMTAQSPEPFFRDTYGDKLQAAVRVNVSTVVFLPDANVVRGDMPAMYRKLFGLNNNHLELIRSARPKKEYCIYHPQTGEFRVVVMNLPYQVVARLMSNKTSLTILKNTYDPNDPMWKDRYLHQLIQSEFRHVR